MATDYSPGLSSHVAYVALAQTHDPALLRSVVPDGINGAPLLYALAKEPLPDAFLRLQDGYLKDAAERDPKFVAARTLAVQRLLAALEAPDGTGRCVDADQTRCAREILAHCAALDELQEPRVQEPTVFRARLFMAIGRPAVAARMLATACEQFDERQQCLRTWLQAAANARDPAMAGRAAKALELDGCSGQHRCAGTYTLIGKTLGQAGDPMGELAYYERAAREEPTPIRWNRAADAATGIGDQRLAKGDTPGAIKYYERAAGEAPSLDRWRKVSALEENPASREPPAPSPPVPRHAPQGRIGTR